MLLAENLASIESEGRRLALAAREDPKRQVPQYPGWTMEDLVSHTASIHARTTAICRELPTERLSAPRLPEGTPPIEWYEATLDEMLEALTSADSSHQVWGFGPDPDIGFWERRMVVETGVHRWDAYQALGREDRLTDHVAASGLDEFADMWIPRMEEVPPIRMVADDLHRTWAFGFGEPVDEVVGPASELYLRLMARKSSIELPAPWASAVDSLEPPPKR